MENQKNLIPNPPPVDSDPAKLYAERPPDLPQTFAQLYSGASLLEISQKEKDTLNVPVNNAEVEIRPDGLLYLPQVFVREKLNAAFGPGQWALIQNGITIVGNTLCFDGSLVIRGKFVSRAMGEADYIRSNKNMSWATVYESAKSDAIARACKDLGVAKELWQPQFCRKWEKEYSVKVYRTKKGEYAFRRKDVSPFYDEQGTPAGTTNQAAQGTTAAPAGQTPDQGRPPLRKCPACGSDAIIASKPEYGGGFVCYKRKGGCGKVFEDAALTIPREPKPPNGNGNGKKPTGTPGGTDSPPPPSDDQAPPETEHPDVIKHGPPPSGAAQALNAVQEPDKTPPYNAAPISEAATRKRTSDIADIRGLYEKSKGALFVRAAGKAIFYCVNVFIKQNVASWVPLKNTDISVVLEHFKNAPELERTLSAYIDKFESNKGV